MMGHLKFCFHCGERIPLESAFCEYCGKHTHEIEYDYMVGTNHLQCELERESTLEIDGC